MTIRKGLIPLLLSLTLVAIFSGCSSENSQNGSDNIQKIRIITTGFMQGQISPFERHYSRGRIKKYGGPANVATVIDELIAQAESENSTAMVVDLGDNLSGSAEALLTKGEVMAKILSNLPLTASLIGNLEFAHGQKALTHYFQDLNVPFVSTNISGTDNSQLPFTNKYIEVMAGTTKILIAGLSPPNLKYICLPSNTEGVEVMEWFDKPLKLMNEEKEKRNASILLVLSQESLGKKDEKLRKALNNNKVDLFVGLDFNRKGIIRESENGYTITFPGHNRGQRIGITDLSYSPSRGIFAISTRFKTVEADAVHEKPSVAKWINEAAEKYRTMLDEKIAVAATDLDRMFFEESDTGNLVADAIREKTGSQIVCINSGGIATDISKGPVILRDLYSLIPYQNKVISFTISGADLINFLMKTLGKGSPLQVSGINLELRSIEGKRGYEIINMTVNNLPIDESKTYLFATNDFVKDRSPQLIPVGNVSEHGLVRDTVIDFLKSKSPYSATPKGRINLR